MSPQELMALAGHGERMRNRGTAHRVTAAGESKFVPTIAVLAQAPSWIGRSAVDESPAAVSRLRLASLLAANKGERGKNT